jgi:hypothetical protein
MLPAKDCDEHGRSDFSCAKNALRAFFAQEKKTCVGAAGAMFVTQTRNGDAMEINTLLMRVWRR